MVCHDARALAAAVAATGTGREVIEARFLLSPEEPTTYFTRNGEALSAVRLSTLTRGRLIEAIKKKAETAPNGSRKRLAPWKQWSNWAALHDHMTADLIGVVTVWNIGLPMSLPPPQSRDRVLTPDDLAAVMTGNGRDARQLRLRLATGCRVGEALGLTPDTSASTGACVPPGPHGSPASFAAPRPR